MTFQWVAVASFLYGEIAVLLILCIPFISPLRWKKIFRFQLWSILSPYWNKAFLSIIVVLIVLFLDAGREVKKYSANPEIDKNAKLYASAYDHIHMKLFRSQRNLYISGFSLFLWLVLRRVTSLIMQLASEMEGNDSLQTEVENAHESARKHMEEKEDLQKAINRGNLNEEKQSVKADNEKMKNEVGKLKEELKRVTEALFKSQNEVNSLKKQSENLTREYNHLVQEHEQLQNAPKGMHDKKDQ
ncbi:B-cell receptor-associated protein 29 [Rhinophrynus dorsalis]